MRRLISTADTRLQLRAALIEPETTDACRLLHGAGDGWPGFYVDRLGDYLLALSDRTTDARFNAGTRPFGENVLRPWRLSQAADLQVRRTSAAQASPQLVLGEAAPARFTVRENGLQFELSFSEGYSAGLFLDQRDNRRRLLTTHIAASFPLFLTESVTRKSEILNTFAYTCGFSVCAAKAGARTTSLDLSKKYLDWGQHNFALNQFDPAKSPLHSRRRLRLAAAAGEETPPLRCHPA